MCVLWASISERTSSLFGHVLEVSISLLSFFFNKKALQQCALFELDRGYVA